MFRGAPVTTGLLLIGEELAPIPLQNTRVRATISAGIAEVRVTQQFRNTHDRAVEAVYLFPLPEDAAVNSMRILVGDRTIEGEALDKTEARATYLEAKGEGHGAALVEETSSNIFTASVANLLPGQEVQVAITYLQPLPFDEGQFRFVFPMVIAPRYVLGAGNAAESLTTEVSAGMEDSRLPQGMLRGDTVDLEVDVDSAVPLRGFDSPSHDIVTLAEQGASRVRIALRRTDEIPNRDFVLNCRVAGATIEQALLYEPERAGEPGTFLLLATPPFGTSAMPPERELTFVLDCSWSMAGDAFEQARQTLRQLLDRLQPTDEFNIIAFSDSLTTFSPNAVPAEESNLRRARAFLDQLKPGGGKEMLQSLRRALNQASAEEKQHDRIVVFISDGWVDADNEVVGAIGSLIGQARIVICGIGTAVNRRLLHKMATAGKGFAEFIYPGENIGRVVDRMLQRLSEPVLTNVAVEWEGGSVSKVLPERCGDLYCNLPLLVLGRFRGPLPPRLTLRGKLRDQSQEYACQLSDARRHEGGVRLAALWARQQIESLLEQIWRNPPQRAELRQQIIDLALQHRLCCEFTSFLAVEYRGAGERKKSHSALKVTVPQIMPAHIRPFLETDSLMGPVRFGEDSGPLCGTLEGNFEALFGTPERIGEAPLDQVARDDFNLESVLCQLNGSEEDVADTQVLSQYVARSADMPASSSPAPSLNKTSPSIKEKLQRVRAPRESLRSTTPRIINLVLVLGGAMMVIALGALVFMWLKRLF